MNWQLDEAMTTPRGEVWHGTITGFKVTVIPWNADQYNWSINPMAADGAVSDCIRTGVCDTVDAAKSAGGALATYLKEYASARNP
jgi:hypothetical protein